MRETPGPQEPKRLSDDEIDNRLKQALETYRAHQREAPTENAIPRTGETTVFSESATPSMVVVEPEAKPIVNPFPKKEVSKRPYDTMIGFARQATAEERLADLNHYYSDEQRQSVVALRNGSMDGTRHGWAEIAEITGIPLYEAKKLYFGAKAIKK